MYGYLMSESEQGANHLWLGLANFRLTSYLEMGINTLAMVELFSSLLPNVCILRLLPSRVGPGDLEREGLRSWASLARKECVWSAWWATMTLFSFELMACRQSARWLTSARSPYNWSILLSRSSTYQSSPSPWDAWVASCEIGKERECWAVLLFMLNVIIYNQRRTLGRSSFIQFKASPTPSLHESCISSAYSGCAIIFKLMDHPFLADYISQIHEADTLYDSRLSSLSRAPQESVFEQQRSFARSVLGGWGLTLGELPYSRENEATVRCLAELAAHRQKDLQFRSRAKEDMVAMQFERDKFRSFAEQAQRTAEEHLRKIGTLENELNGIRARGRKGEAQTRRQRDEDRKVIAALRAKNQQVLHEVKKREVQAARVREQMKKSVGEKSTPAKATFEVYLPPRLPAKDQETDKYAFLLQRNERELSLAVRENSLLREKLFEIRESLVRFNAWIDREIFGEDVEDGPELPRGYDRKFYINHNLLFKKESLTEELDALLDLTRDGLTQLREINRGNRSPPRLPEGKAEEVELNFRKKPSRREIKTDRIVGGQGGGGTGENRPNRTSIGKRAEGSAERQLPLSPRSAKQVPQQSLPSEGTVKVGKGGAAKAGEGKKVGSVVSRPMVPVAVAKPAGSPGQLPFEDDLLSEVSSGHDSSIISHISMEQMGRSRFDKWDILYQEE